MTKIWGLKKNIENETEELEVEIQVYSTKLIQAKSNQRLEIQQDMYIDL